MGNGNTTSLLTVAERFLLLEYRGNEKLFSWMGVRDVFSLSFTSLVCRRVLI